MLPLCCTASPKLWWPSPLKMLYSLQEEYSGTNPDSGAIGLKSHLRWPMSPVTANLTHLTIKPNGKFNIYWGHRSSSLRAQSLLMKELGVVLLSTRHSALISPPPLLVRSLAAFRLLSNKLSLCHEPLDSSWHLATLSPLASSSSSATQLMD